MEVKVINESNDHKYFTIIPNYILNHSSAVDKAVYIDMKRVAGDDGICFMTEETLCKRNKIGEKKLHESLNYLLEHHWIEFVGMTPSKTRPIKTYKVLDLWNKNMEYYQDKKIPVESGVSLPKKKDTLQKQDMIPVRSSVEEEPIKEELNNQATDVAGVNFYKKKTLESIGSVLTKFTVPVKKTHGASYQWQDTAVRWWKKLGLNGKPTAGWFKLFKSDLNLAERSCSWVSDSGGRDIEKLTYWAFNQFKKYGRIKYEKSN